MRGGFAVRSIGWDTDLRPRGLPLLVIRLELNLANKGNGNFVALGYI